MVRSAPRAGGGASHLVQGRDAQEPQVGPQGGLGSAHQSGAGGGHPWSSPHDPALRCSVEAGEGLGQIVEPPGDEAGIEFDHGFVVLIGEGQQGIEHAAGVALAESGPLGLHPVEAAAHPAQDRGAARVGVLTIGAAVTIQANAGLFVEDDGAGWAVLQQEVTQTGLGDGFGPAALLSRVDMAPPHDVGGQRDITARVLRHVTDAFAEDPVRILRVARFAARFPDFSIAPDTMALMQRMVTDGEVDALVPERVWQELARGLMAQQPSRMFEVLRACGALTKLLPEVARLWGVPQRAEYHP